MKIVYNNSLDTFAEITGNRSVLRWCLSGRCYRTCSGCRGVNEITILKITYNTNLNSFAEIIDVCTYTYNTTEHTAEHLIEGSSSKSTDYLPGACTRMQTGGSGALVISAVTVKFSVEGTATLYTSVLLSLQFTDNTERSPMVSCSPLSLKTMDEFNDVLSVN